MVGIVPGWLPGGVFWVYVTGLVLVAACISLIINKYTVYAALGLAVLMFIFVLTVHLPSLLGGDQMALTMLLKDFGLGSAALLVAHINLSD